MATSSILGRDVYLALAAVGWSDGSLDADEADAIVRTALEEGLSLDAIEEIERATKTRTPMSVIDRLNMTKSDRLYVYAVACWITRLDGVVGEDEEEALAGIAKELAIPDGPRAHADATLREIAALPAGDRPDRLDLKRLRTALDVRLSVAQLEKASR